MSCVNECMFVVLSILKYLSIQAMYADIDNVEYNIKIYYLAGTTIVFSFKESTKFEEYTGFHY